MYYNLVITSARTVLFAWFALPVASISVFLSFGKVPSCVAVVVTLN